MIARVLRPNGPIRREEHLFAVRDLNTGKLRRIIPLRPELTRATGRDEADRSMAGARDRAAKQKAALMAQQRRVRPRRSRAMELEND